MHPTGQASGEGVAGHLGMAGLAPWLVFPLIGNYWVLRGPRFGGHGEF